MSMLQSREVLLHPTFTITLNGSELPPHLRSSITSVQITESDKEANMGVISVSDAMYKWVNLSSLKKKAPVTITLGHEKKSRLMLDGVVEFIEADYGDDGIPTLSIGVIDLTSKMHSSKKERVWKGKSGLQVAKAVAGEYGFSVKSKGTSPVRDQITQEDETDAQLIHRLAEDDGFVCYMIVDQKTMYYGDRFADLKEKDTLFYNSGDCTVISFSPTFVEKNKPSNDVKKKSDVSDKTGDKVDSSKKPPSGGSSGGSSSGGGSKAGASGSKTGGINVTTGAVNQRK